MSEMALRDAGKPILRETLPLDRASNNAAVTRISGFTQELLFGIKTISALDEQGHVIRHIRFFREFHEKVLLSCCIDRAEFQ